MELLTKNSLWPLFLSLLGATLIGLGSLLSFKLPGSNIPMTAQTLAVLVVAGFFGPLVGFVSVVIYLIVGIVGFPVFAEGAMGVETFMGPTRGYLFGFIFAALLSGWWCSQKHNRFFFSAFTIMVLAHILILALGWMWLSSKIGPAAAFLQGVFPFFYGALIKSLVAAVLIIAYFKLKTYFLGKNNKEIKAL